MTIQKLQLELQETDHMKHFKISMPGYSCRHVRMKYAETVQSQGVNLQPVVLCRCSLERVFIEFWVKLMLVPKPKYPRNVVRPLNNLGINARNFVSKNCF